MGCDIHLFPEYKTNGVWFNMPLNEYGDRNYDLFGILAEGVRVDYNVTLNDSDEIPEDELVKVHEPNGIPNDVSYMTRRRLCYYVKRGEMVDALAENTITPTKAEMMESFGATYYDEKKEWLINPDWHSLSWITLDELKELLEEYEKACGCEATTSYWALYNYMKTYADEGVEVRLVYWFDN